MRFTKTKRALSLGLAAAQLVPLTAVVLNVSASADVAKVSSSVKKQTVFTGVSVEQAAIGGKPVEAKLIGNTVEILKPTNTKLDDLTPASGETPAVQDTDIFVKLNFDSKLSKHIAFDKYGLYLNEKGECENIGDGFVGFHFNWDDKTLPRLGTYKVTFRTYEDEVVAKKCTLTAEGHDNTCGEFWLKGKQTTPENPGTSSSTESTSTPTESTSTPTESTSTPTESSTILTESTSAPTSTAAVQAVDAPALQPANDVQITNHNSENNSFVSGENAPKALDELTLTFKYVTAFTDTFNLKCTAPDKAGYSVNLLDSNNRRISKAKEGDTVKISLTVDNTHVASNVPEGWTVNSSNSRNFIKEYKVSAADITDGNTTIDLTSELNGFAVEKCAKVNLDSKLRYAKAEALEINGIDLFNTNKELKQGDQFLLKITPNRGYTFDDAELKVELSGKVDNKMTTFEGAVSTTEEENVYLITIPDLSNLSGSTIKLSYSGTAKRDRDYKADITLSILKKELKNATVTTDLKTSSKVAEGDEVEVTVTPNKGYVFNTVPTIDDEAMQSIPNSDAYKLIVTIPYGLDSKKYEINVKGEGELRECYVTIRSTSDGEITVRKGGKEFDLSESVKMNDRLTLVAKADKGYRFKEWDVTGGTMTGNTLKVDGTGDIVIDAEFVDRYYYDDTSSDSSGSNDYWYDDDDYYNYSTDSVKIDGKNVSRYDMNSAIRSSTNTTVNVDLSNDQTNVTDGTRTMVYSSTTKAITDAVSGGSNDKSAEVKLSNDITLIIDKSSVNSIEPSYAITVTEQKNTVNPAAKADNSAVRGTAVKSFTASNVGTAKADIAIGALQNGNFANVYRVNSVTHRSEFVSTAKISGGKVRVSLNGDGQYIIMAGKYSDLKGDTDNDGIMNANDAVELLKQAARVKVAENNDRSVADVNADGKVNVHDAVSILKLIAGVKI